MKIGHTYHQALAQVADRVREAVENVCAASADMVGRRPQAALDHLQDAKDAIEGAMVSAKWATTLPEEDA